MNRFEYFRRIKNLTIKETALLTGLHPATISRIERGVVSPNVATLEKLAEAYVCEVKDFFSTSNSQ